MSLFIGFHHVCTQVFMVSIVYIEIRLASYKKIRYLISTVCFYLRYDSQKTKKTDNGLNRRMKNYLIASFNK